MYNFSNDAVQNERFKLYNKNCFNFIINHVGECVHSHVTGRLEACVETRIQYILSHCSNTHILESCVTTT